MEKKIEENTFFGEKKLPTHAIKNEPTDFLRNNINFFAQLLVCGCCSYSRCRLTADKVQPGDLSWKLREQNQTLYVKMNVFCFPSL